MSLEFPVFVLSALEDVASILHYINDSILFYSMLSQYCNTRIQVHKNLKCEPKEVSLFISNEKTLCYLSPVFSRRITWNITFVEGCWKLRNLIISFVHI